MMPSGKINNNNNKNNSEKNSYSKKLGKRKNNKTNNKNNKLNENNKSDLQKSNRTDEKQNNNDPLKYNSDIQTWNRMAKNPSKLLLNDPDVKRWYENMRRSSSVTCTVRLGRLNLFCYRIEMTPQELVAVGKDDPMKAENIILDHVSWMEEKGYSPGYTHGMVMTVKSWLDYNHIEIRRKIKIKNMDVPVTIQDERIPDRKQLKRMLDSADSRSRVIISIIALAGVRPQVLGLADRSDGLVLSDLPDLVLDGDDTRFETVPAMVVVRSSISKIRKKYFTFLAEEGCRYVLEYLQERRLRGEQLVPSSPLVTVYHGYGYNGWAKKGEGTARFMHSNAISVAIRPIIWSVTKVRPYALRAYFDSQMLIAESHGTMTHAYRQFFMGHKGDMEARYTTNKGQLTEQMTEDMRRAYKQSQPFLSIDAAAGTEESKREILIGMWRQQAEMYGVNVDSMLAAAAVASGDAGLSQPVAAAGNNRSSGMVSKYANNVQGAPALENGGLHYNGTAGETAMVQAAAPTVSNNNSAPKECPFESRIVVDDADLLAHTADGWDLVKDLPGERFLVRRKVSRS